MRKHPIGVNFESDLGLEFNEEFPKMAKDYLFREELGSLRERRVSEVRENERRVWHL